MSEPKRYRKTATITATPWFKHGDHPAVGHWRYPPVDPESGEVTAGAEGILLGKVRHCDTPAKFRREDCTAIMHDHGWIDTLEGGHTVCPADVIADGDHDDHWPIKPWIFEATYEPVPEGQDRWLN